jgi:hypothetical protein
VARLQAEKSDRTPDRTRGVRLGAAAPFKSFKSVGFASCEATGYQRGLFGRQTRQAGHGERRTSRLQTRPFQPSATPPKHTDARREEEKMDVRWGIF